MDEPTSGAEPLGVVLDTSVLVFLERRQLSAPGLRVLVPRDALVAAIQVAELRVGLLMADSEARQRARSQFLDDIRANCAIAPFTESEASVYASVAVHLRRNGQIIGERDLQIAATAVAGGHELMTYNVDEFRRVPGLLLRPVP